MNILLADQASSQQSVVSGLSDDDIEIFTNDIPSMQLAMERGDVSMVNSKLYDLPAFIPWAMSASEAQKAAVLKAIEWLDAAKAYEAVHGEGSKRDPNHWLNIWLDRNLRKLRENQKRNKEARLRAESRVES